MLSIQIWNIKNDANRQTEVSSPVLSDSIASCDSFFKIVMFDQFNMRQLNHRPEPNILHLIYFFLKFNILFITVFSLISADLTSKFMFYFIH